MDRRELIGFLAGFPLLTALAEEIEAAPEPQPPGAPVGAVGTKLLYENDQVKVWEFALDPNEAIPMHTHTMDYLFHVYQGSTLEVSFPGDKPKVSVPLKVNGLGLLQSTRRTPGIGSSTRPGIRSKDLSKGISSAMRLL